MTLTEPPRRSWVAQLMGLPFSVLARGPAARDGATDDAVGAVFAELAEQERRFSPYLPGSDVSRLARGELALADCAPAVREVAACCEHWRLRTEGRFDATTPGGSWDPSGLVKGWAAEQAAGRHLAPLAGIDWCLNAGGDVWVHCPSGTPLVVGVQDPADPAQLVDAVPCLSGAVATSGTAARGAHLYDPLSGRAVSRAGSLTVTGPSLCTADVLATAGFVAGSGGLALVARHGYEALRIDPTGGPSWTGGWPGDRLGRRP